MSGSHRRTKALKGARVALRTLREEDMAAIGRWYEGADGLQQLLEDSDRRVLAITPRGDDGPIGVLSYRLDANEGWVTFELVAVEPSLVGLGLESEAVRLLEEEAARPGRADRFRAQVNRGEGLGLYFWLRLGYRPAPAAEAARQRGSRRDIIPMIRVGTAS